MEQGPAKLVIRPERVHLDPTTDPSTAINVTVERTIYLGAMISSRSTFARAR
ncbi:MAG: TOBE domain-containing protein [Actinobacteria bacterium]|nr:TOBE domain-containing protein [Actinomycetota bacterium]